MEGSSVPSSGVGAKNGRLEEGSESKADRNNGGCQHNQDAVAQAKEEAKAGKEKQRAQGKGKGGSSKASTKKGNKGKTVPSSSAVVTIDGNPHSVYHEKQRRGHCGLHSVNNLLQRAAYTVNDFNAICYELSPHAFINPHKSMWGLGYYDVNVLEMALRKAHYSLNWFDKRKSAQSIDLDACFGFLLNLQQRRKMGAGVGSHWIGVRRVCGAWLNLDSKLPEPRVLPDDASVRTMFDCCIAEGAFLFLVKSEEPAKKEENGGQKEVKGVYNRSVAAPVCAKQEAKEEKQQAKEEVVKEKASEGEVREEKREAERVKQGVEEQAKQPHGKEKKPEEKRDGKEEQKVVCKDSLTEGKQQQQAACLTRTKETAVVMTNRSQSGSSDALLAKTTTAGSKQCETQTDLCTQTKNLKI